MLTHELNNYTMQEAINMYPKLKAAFDVSPFPFSKVSFLISFLFVAPRSRSHCAQPDATLRGDELYHSYFRTMYVLLPI